MKLRNKKTGEIDDFLFEVIKDRINLYRRVGHSDTKNIWHYNSLTELNEEWEEYEEEPKEYWFIDIRYPKVEPKKDINLSNSMRKRLKEIGNYFETKEEAERAVEKLKAWKRPKDKGIRFNGWKCTGSISFAFDNYCGDGQPMSASDYLDLLFGGEE